MVIDSAHAPGGAFARGGVGLALGAVILIAYGMADGFRFSSPACRAASRLQSVPFARARRISMGLLAFYLEGSH